MGGAASAVGVANPPWPCTAGGHHISKPRLRQGQLPNGRYRPRGISGLTHRAAPPALYLGRLDPRRNGLDALRQVADAGLLPVRAGERKVAAVDLDDDLAHLTPPVRAAGRAWRARRRSARRSPQPPPS